MNEVCSNCKFSKPLTYDKEYLLKRKELAETKLAQIRAEQEKARRSWFSGMGDDWFDDTYWFNTLVDVNAKLKALEKDVMCHRFPATVQKRKTDVCGEWKV